MNEDSRHKELESDPRFPSGAWTGFFLQKQAPKPGRHLMELQLEFENGVMKGEGRDWVGPFHIRGRYDLADGKCYWTKRYDARHDVFYTGFNEGKGIWGTWEIPPEQNLNMRWTGGFHIWPEGMADLTKPHLTEKADPPIIIESEVEENEPIELTEPLPSGAR